MGMIDWPTLVGVAGGAISAYVAIKSDLAALHVKCDSASKVAQTAHKRLDQHLAGAHHETKNAKA